jgi:hypothetical protein
VTDSTRGKNYENEKIFQHPLKDITSKLLLQELGRISKPIALQQILQGIGVHACIGLLLG